MTTEKAATPHPGNATITIADLAGSVVRVGDGRGFVVHGEREDTYVVTAAHCLPKIPEAHLARYTEESTFFNLLGPIGAEPSVTAACLFCDVVADLAVLGGPDNQELSAEADTYEEFTTTRPPFDIAALPPRMRRRIAGIHDAPPTFTPFRVVFPAQVLSLSGAWIDCPAEYWGGTIIAVPDNNILRAGMSGSPLISATGAALGLIGTDNMVSCLAAGLPGWLLQTLMHG